MTFKIETTTKVNNIALFSFSQQVVDSKQKIVSWFCVTEDTLTVFFDEELSVGKTLEVRGDGIWSDVIHEVNNEHWSLSMESFALRMSHEEFKVQELHQDLIGERIPYGYDLDCTSEDGQNWLLSGNIIVGRTSFELSNEQINLSN